MSRLGILASSAAVPLLAYVGSTSSVATQTVFTFTNHAIGAAVSNRLVVVAITAEAAAGRTISSVTIGGVAATVDSTTNPSTSAPATFAWRVVPTGTTATIAVTFSGDATSCAIHVFTVANLSSTTPLDSDTAVAASPNAVTIDTQANGVLIAGAVSIAAGAFTWSGATEHYDQNVNSNQFSAAANDNTSGPPTAAQASGGSGSYRVSAISWR